MLNQIAELCRQAGTFQLGHFRSVETDMIVDKGLNQLVSFVDIETEKMLVQGLQKLVPDSTFVTEENTIVQNQKSDKYWIIDPLDGTTNFLHGLGAFSISIAYVEGGEIKYGVVYIPHWNEMFTAEKNGGAFLNGEPIAVTKNIRLSDTLIATGFPYYEFDHMKGYLKTLAQLMKTTHGLRRMGSAAIDLAYVACGRFDGFFEYGLNAWDVAAGVLLIEEAGGMVSDFKGEGDYIYGKSIVASNKEVYGDFLDIIQLHISE
ncbi:MAG: inositol monophosphatase [Bacteroidetes bacterium]|nr:inositol monophosphatase [Bacteroidota bacterium]